MKFVSDWRECYELSVDRVGGTAPTLLSRIGGSDTNAVACYLENQENNTAENNQKLSHHLDLVQRYNGYYDRAGDPSKYILYLQTLLDCYKNSEYLFHCNFQLLSMYFPNNIDKSFYASDIDGRRGFELLIDVIGGAGRTKANLPYSFIEKLTSHPYSLFNSFTETLPGKKVLVISPFSESIVANFSNRGGFFKNYEYPEFSLSVINVPITYAGLPSEFYPHEDWFETVQALKDAISTLDFDIALLSCGSYAMPIGQFIFEAMHKKAVYVGGILQLYFGILGRRYADNSFFLDQINPEHFIFPFEGRRFLDHVWVNADTAREAFGAYF